MLQQVPSKSDLTFAIKAADQLATQFIKYCSRPADISEEEVKIHLTFWRANRGRIPFPYLFLADSVPDGFPYPLITPSTESPPLALKQKFDDCFAKWVCRPRKAFDLWCKIAASAELMSIKLASAISDGPADRVQPDHREAEITSLLVDNAVALRKLLDVRSDGPEPPHHFWWKERRVQMDMEPKCWELLLFLWPEGKEPREYALIQDIGKTVWNDRSMHFDSMKSTFNRLHNALMSNEIPLEWNKKRGHNAVRLSR